MPAPLVKIDLEFPYTRSVGPVIGAYLDGLEAGRLLASRAGDRTLSPPLEYDPATGASVEPELVEVGPEGVDHVVDVGRQPNPNHPLDRPFAFALIQLDGADTAMVHVVDGPRVGIGTGVRVRPRWRDERTGYVTDIECFECRERMLRAGYPGGREPRERPTRRRTRTSPRIMPFPVALHYEMPAAPALTRYGEALVDGKHHRPAVHRRLRPGVRAAARLLPHRRDRAHDRRRRRARRPRHHRQLHRGDAGAVPGPGGDRALRPRLGRARRPGRHAAAPGRPRHAGRATCASACGSPRCGGRRRSATSTSSPPAGGAAPTAASRAGCRPASPTLDVSGLAGKGF